MVEIIVPVASFIFVFLVVKAFLDYRTRQKLVDKGLVDENVKYLFAEKLDSQFLSSLKWGLVLIGIGIAVFIGQFVETEKSDEITAGAMFVFAGLALLIHYGIANRLSKKSKTNGPSA
ncbi:MAG: hypothetical protein A2145_04505 [candidate division Zixibacteria bacterium RBG_16_40_9]|nr:MAG: hypothetical protein A2145_04505 [candidate division Zixibacteria bacterium RBG_16_40_9]